jgi:serine protease inhibitor
MIPGETISQMLVFNGLYFKGIWATPFVGQMEGSFYKSESEKVAVTMMNTQGNFRVGNVPDLDSVAIELPYKVPTTFNNAAREVN